MALDGGRVIRILRGIGGRMARYTLLIRHLLNTLSINARGGVTTMTENSDDKCLFYVPDSITFGSSSADQLLADITDLMNRPLDVCPVCNNTGVTYDFMEDRNVPCGGINCRVQR